MKSKEFDIVRERRKRIKLIINCLRTSSCIPQIVFIECKSMWCFVRNGIKPGHLTKGINSSSVIIMWELIRIRNFPE